MPGVTRAWRGPGEDAGAAPDAGNPDAGPCWWYLGELSATCTQTCASRSGFDTRSTAYVGTAWQGGTLANGQTIWPPSVLPRLLSRRCRLTHSALAVIYGEDGSTGSKLRTLRFVQT